MIPKIIHYCWFGTNPLPKFETRCIESWKKFCPDYELMLWNEKNFDINSNIFVKEAYEARKFAFVADYVRLWAIHKYGGIYMDTDVEVKKTLTPFLIHPAFIGFESRDMIATCIMASEKGGTWAARELAYYNNRHFLLENGGMDCKTNVKIISEHFEQDGLLLNNTYQEHKNLIVVYPQEYFSPKDFHNRKNHYSENSCTVHHFSMSWLPWHKRCKRRWKRFRRQIKNNICKIFHCADENGGCGGL